MMDTKEILKRLDTLGEMMYEKCGTDSYIARCYLHDTKELLKQGQSLPVSSVSQQGELFIDFTKEVIEQWEKYDIGDEDIYNKAKKLINGG
jgi:hypothetical protein